MNFISLFAGIGGFDLGLERAGMECDSVVEIDKNCQVMLKRHFPNAKIYNDVKGVGLATHERKSIDLICGGFPCQDLSIAGKRQGLAGERSVLWYEFARIIDELEPQWVVIENVPGLLSSNKGKDFAIIIRWLAERGYGVAWRVLDAQYFGVPQRRRRVFIVGSFGDGRAAEVLFERESSPGDTPPGRKKGKEVAYSLRANPSHSGDKGNGGINTTLIAKSLSTNPANRLSREDNYIAGTLNNGFPGRDASDAADGKLVIGPLQAHSKRHGHAMTTQQAAESGQFITWNWQSGGDIRHNFNEKPMLQASQVHAVGVRRLTPTECERLQGFPDNWTDGQSDSIRYRQLGNAVAVPVIEWIGRRIVKARSEK